MQWPLFFDLHDWLASAALGYARLAPIFYMLPFLNSDLLSGVVRNAVIVMVALGLWPYTPHALAQLNGMAYIGLLAREATVGILLGSLLSLPFWVFHALGSIIDNQRGATLSSSIDPTTGVDTSEMSNFLNLFSVAVYLQNGGVSLMLDVLSRSYQICEPFLSCSLKWTSIFSLINIVMSKSLVLASPVIAALLLSEILLGLLSRFAAQLNAFSIALTIKSGVALLIMLLYFRPVLPGVVMDLAPKPNMLSGWLGHDASSSSQNGSVNTRLQK